MGWMIPVLTPAAALPREYLTSCRWDELIGLQFHWKATGIANPAPGHDWVVCGKEVATGWFEWKGGFISNCCQNKYYGRPVGKSGPIELLVFPEALGRDGRPDYSRVHLWENTFYRP